jgi:ABC-2 type transport system ATP-binding protein/lipopolysaccharide transport system ATP-binding protein
MVRQYLASGLASAVEGEALVRSGGLTLHTVHVRSQNNPAGGPLMRTDPLDVTVEFELTEEVPGLDLAIYVTTRGGVRVLDEVLSDDGEQRFRAGRYRAHMVVPPVLNLGDFAVGVWFGTPHMELIDEPAAATFELHGGDRRRPERVTVLDLPITVRPVQSAH